ncbi:MAG: DUF349 domain-containing protein [Bacteroidales bacterium]|nr:DUF349 domain-containing protein [Bacteroidales bacterium]MBQ2103725.1 DUF349 domain-containing protein [Bacteroidales bacterium]MBQ3983920.1 DUF349 domain-containing protein [Bacteroidales bacterium]MBQ4188673.1 DUF349 domain-containing protein [Bacteroidales bacterium]MBQ5417087.1 DUF349 domain-containing protein [Bacteroidales bacterium]
MSENIIPDVVNQASDVLETVEAAVEQTVETATGTAEKTFEELIASFKEIFSDEQKMKRQKELEAIRTAFYKKLNKEKTEENPLSDIEESFKSLYEQFKAERAEYNKTLDKERGENLEKKKAVLEDLKALVETQEDINATFPAFRDIQARWKEIGPVPAANFRDINDSYQYYVVKFYDMVKINHELRDLDFKKNLEVKEKFCEAAEKLAENPNVVEAFRELQKLHEQWKEYGPVDKEHRESIWERFKAATAVINKKYQAHFEDLKGEQAENLAAKSKLCEKVEEIAAKAEAGEVASNEWNVLASQIEGIQKEWKSIGFASKKDNQKIYDRFRAACDRFYLKKRDFYVDYKGSMVENLAKKVKIVEQAEALKASTEWKKATDQFIQLQKQWKEIGPVAHKKGDQLWKRFRAACDEFFAERDKNAKPENDYHFNLKAKKKIIEEINAYVPSDDAAANEEAAKEFIQKWQAIGFVPFKEKEKIAAAYKEAFQAKFPGMNTRGGQRGSGRNFQKAPRSEKDILIQQYNALQQDIDTYENNIGFFAMSKNSEPLIKQMRDKIEVAKGELKALQDKIRQMEEAEAANEQE